MNVHTLTLYTNVIVGGHWSKWSAFTQCSKTCDGGIRKRTRSCYNPAPRPPTEKGCPDIAHQEEICNTISCRKYFFSFSRTRFYCNNIDGKYVLHCLFRLFDHIFYITGTELTELGETCKDRGWLPISSLAECKASTEYFQRYYPSYVFIEEEGLDYLPKGCSVDTYYGTPEGYFNTRDSDYIDSNFRALCTKPEG